MQIFISDFLNHLQSKNTIESYKNDLNQFCVFYRLQFDQDVSHPNQIGETICVMWMHHLRQKHFKTRTITRKINSISSFLKFCQSKNLININPIAFLNRPKTPKIGATNILTREECSHIFECLFKRMEFARISDNQAQFKLWKTRYTILYTLFTVGMRVSELCQLKRKNLEQIDENTYRLHFTAKGNEKHAPLIHKNTALVLLDYMNMFCVSDDDFIFGGMSRITVHNLIKKSVEISGITKNISAHSFRASLATHLHQISVPLGHIKDLLNHKNIGTTILYTRVSDAEMQENAILLDI